MGNPALWVAISSVIGAVSGLIGVWRHGNGPKHRP